MYRQEEYRKHPLFRMLSIHTSELQEYIRLKREQQVQQKQKEFQMNHQMTAVYGQQTETPKRDIFKVSKDWSNAPDGFEESDLPRAIEIRKLIEQEKNPVLKEDEKMVQLGEVAEAAEPSQDQIEKEESKQ